MATQNNLYSILGLDSSASTEEITRAYRNLALQLHPDRNREEGATAAFQKLQNAYETLKDPTRRARYDRIRRTAQASRSVFTPDPPTQSRSTWNSEFNRNRYKTGAQYDPGYQFKSYPKQNPGPEYEETYAAEFKEQIRCEREEAEEAERERLEREHKAQRERHASRFLRHRAEFEAEMRRQEEKREEDARREAAMCEENWEEKVEEFRRNMRNKHQGDYWDEDGEE